MKIKAKTKGIIKKVSLALAGVIAISAIGVGVAKLVEYTKEDLKTITPSFSVGNLGTDGKYVNDESTLYTKEAFQCDGLQIKLDFDNEIEYQIYFYDDLDNFVESTEVLSAAYSETVHDGYARIVIMPTNDEDGKIGLTERLTYPDQMTIKVAKEQNVEYYNVFNQRLMLVNNLSKLRFEHGFIYDKDGTYSFVFGTSKSNAVTATTCLFVDGYSGLQVTIPENLGDSSFGVFEFRLSSGVELINVSYNISDSLTFQKETDFVIFTFEAIDTEITPVQLDGSMLSGLSSFISFVK